MLFSLRVLGFTSIGKSGEGRVGFRLRCQRRVWGVFRGQHVADRGDGPLEELRKTSTMLCALKVKRDRLPTMKIKRQLYVFAAIIFAAIGAGCETTYGSLPSAGPPPVSSEARFKVIVVEGVAITVPDAEHAVWEHASRLISCPKGQLQTHAIALSDHPHTAFVVDGCGQQMVYSDVGLGGPPVVLAIIARFPLAPLPEPSASASAK